MGGGETLDKVLYIFGGGETQKIAMILYINTYIFPVVMGKYAIDADDGNLGKFTAYPSCSLMGSFVFDNESLDVKTVLLLRTETVCPGKINNPIDGEVIFQPSRVFEERHICAWRSGVPRR